MTAEIKAGVKSAVLENQAQIRLREIVAEAEHRFEGGTKFFDYVDHEVTTPLFFDCLLQLVVGKYGDMMNWRQSPPDLVVSGKWGSAFALWLNAQRDVTIDGWPVYVFPGDLRHTDLVDAGFDPKLPPACVLLDNSMYRSRTRDKIDAYLRKYGSRIVHTWVAYDGMAEPDEGVTSLYRWFDEHPEDLP